MRHPKLSKLTPHQEEQLAESERLQATARILRNGAAELLRSEFTTETEYDAVIRALADARAIQRKATALFAGTLVNPQRGHAHKAR